MNCLVWKGGHCQDPRERASADTTRTLFRVLTPEVASPEQIRGESVTTATDVYALGLLLYLLLTGRSPYGVEARLQGEGGVPNLGDEAAGRRSLMQASALFESLPEPLDVDAGAGLAETYLALHRGSRGKEISDGVYRQKAKTLLDRFLVRAPTHPRVQATSARFWSVIGNEQETEKTMKGPLPRFST